jgi:hypothetical protein
VRDGARTLLGRWPILVFYYLCNVVAAALTIAPAASFIYRRLGHSLESDRELLNLDPAWIAESFRAVREAGWTLVAGTVLIGILYLLWSTFINGGAIAALVRPKDSYFAASARYFPRFFRLLLWSVPVYALVFALSGAMRTGIRKLAEDSMEQHSWVMLGWLRMLIFLALLGCVNMLVDYARIIMVAEQRTGSFRSLLDAVRLVKWRPRTAFGIFFTCQALGVLFLLAYHGLTEITAQTTKAGILLVFVVRQVYTLSRFWVRLLTWSSEVGFYQWLIPEPVEPELPVSTSSFQPLPPPA